MGKDLDDLPHRDALRTVWVVAKAQKGEPLCDGCTPQPAKPAKVASVAGVGTCIKPAMDRRHLKIAGPSTSLVGDCQGCIDSHDPGCTLWKPVFDKAEDLLVGS